MVDLIRSTYLCPRLSCLDCLGYFPRIPSQTGFTSKLERILHLHPRSTTHQPSDPNHHLTPYPITVWNILGGSASAAFPCLGGGQPAQHFLVNLIILQCESLELTRPCVCTRANTLVCAFLSSVCFVYVLFVYWYSVIASDSSVDQETNT